MSVRERMYELTTPDEVDQFLKKFPTSAIFKAGGCHKTMQGFGYVEEAMSPRENLHLGFIRVIENRAASNHVAAITGIVHQSPQWILFIDGKPVFDVDNWDITKEVVQEQLNRYFGDTEKKQLEGSASNVDMYISLLEDFINDRISEDEFEHRWLSTFQLDSSLRSSKEFDLLNSLYGDVDQRIHEKFYGIGSSLKSKGSIKDKAAQLLKSLKQ